MEAFKSTNKELQSSIEEDKQAIKAAEENAQKIKQNFLDFCGQFNVALRCCSGLNTGCCRVLATCDCVLTGAAAAGVWLVVITHHAKTQTRSFLVVRASASCLQEAPGEAP